MASIDAVLTAENGDDLYPHTFDDYISDANGVSLPNRLGTPSQAQSVSGDTAFEKINTLGSDLTKITLRELFRGSVSYTAGGGVIPRSDIPFTYYFPVCGIITDANSTLAVYKMFNGDLQLTNGSPGYSGPLTTVIYGIGWN